MRGRCDTHYLTTGKITSAVLSLMMMIGAVLFHLAKSKTLVDTSIIVTAIFGGGIAERSSSAYLHRSATIARCLPES